MSKVLVDFEIKQQELIRGLEKQRELYLQIDKAQGGVEKTAVTSAQKRERLLKEEIQDLKELKRRREQAFNPEEIQQYNDRIRQTEGRIKNLKGEYGQLEKSNGRLGKSFQVIGTYIAGAFAVDRLVRFGRESIELAGKTEGVRRAFERLNEPTLLNDLRVATRGTVSDLELMQQAVRADNFQLPLNELAKLFEFATLRANQTGESVDYLVNSITEGISKRSIMILDNLGFTTDILSEKLGGVGLRAASTGQIMEAVGKIIDEQMEKAGEQVETTAQRTARLTAENENLKVSVGEALTPVYNEFLEVLNLVYKGFLDIETVMKRVEESRLSDAVKNDRKEVEALAQAYIKNGVALEENDAKVMAAKALINQYKDALKSASDESKEGIVDQIESLADLITTLTTVNETSEKQTELTKEQTEALIRQASAMWALRQATMETQKEIDKQLQQFDFTESQPQQEQGLPIFGIGLDNFEQEQDVMVDGFDKATEEMKELGISNMSDYFEYLRQQNRDAQDEMNQLIIASVGELSNAFLNIQQMQVEAELQAEEDRLQRMEQMQLASLERRFNNEIQGKKLSDRRKNQLEQEYANRQIQIREDYEKKRLKAEAEAARQRRDIALAQAIINTALAVTEALASYNYAGAVFAAIQGAAEVAVISSTPIPEYAKGTEYLQPWAPGQGKKKDDILIYGNKGEAIINAERNKEAPGMAKAWNDGKLDEYIFKQYSMPKIKEALQEIENQKSRDFASNVASAMILNFNDKNLIKELRKGSKESIYYLQQIAENKTRSTRHV